eukprot:g1996.t1
MSGWNGNRFASEPCRFWNLASSHSLVSMPTSPCGVGEEELVDVDEGGDDDKDPPAETGNCSWAGGSSPPGPNPAVAGVRDAAPVPGMFPNTNPPPFVEEGGIICETPNHGAEDADNTTASFTARQRVPRR